MQYVGTIGAARYVSPIPSFCHSNMNFTAATLSPQPSTQQDDVELDEDESAGVVHESLGLVHSDVKLAQTLGKLDITFFTHDHSD